MDREIRQAYNIKASPQEVWRALTDAKEIRQWTGANAFFVPQPGAMYTLWDGQIGGKIVEAVPNRKLVQTWKPEDWNRTDSVVTFTLTPTKDGTRVDLLHENVEEADYEGTTEGWDIYYLGVIKKMLEKRSAKPARATKPTKKATAKKTKPKTKKRANQKKKRQR